MSVFIEEKKIEEEEVCISSIWIRHSYLLGWRCYNITKNIGLSSNWIGGINHTLKASLFIGTMRIPIGGFMNFLNLPPSWFYKCWRHNSILKTRVWEIYRPKVTCNRASLTYSNHLSRDFQIQGRLQLSLLSWIRVNLFGWSKVKRMSKMVPTIICFTPFVFGWDLQEEE